MHLFKRHKFILRKRAYFSNIQVQYETSNLLDFSIPKIKLLDAMEHGYTHFRFDCEIPDCTSSRHLFFVGNYEDIFPPLERWRLFNLYETFEYLLDKGVVTVIKHTR